MLLQPHASDHNSDLYSLKNRAAKAAFVARLLGNTTQVWVEVQVLVVVSVLATATCRGLHRESATDLQPIKGSSRKATAHHKTDMIVHPSTDEQLSQAPSKGG